MGSHPVVQVLVVNALAVLVAVPLGTFGPCWLGWGFLVLALCAQIAQHLHHQRKLEQWTRQPSVDATLEGRGSWDQIFARLYRHEKERAGQMRRLEAAITQFEAAGQALVDGIVLLDARDNIVWCNATAEAQLGLSFASDGGEAITNLVRQPEFIHYLHQQSYAQPLTLRMEFNGSWVFSVHVVPYAETLRLLQIKDVTRTDRLDQMRRDFVANVSHELRTPLTVLNGFLETLQEFELDREETERYLQMMSEQSGRMRTIIQDLLTLSSLEAAPPPECEVIDMARLLDKLYRDAQALSAGRHRVQLECDAQGDLLGNETEIMSALSNLVSNAVRYTPAQGKIILRWNASQTGACFAVEDSGIGIERAHIPRLTERFYRVDRGRSRDNGGTGLGLAIVKHALNRHQARLEIRSEPGKGSTFMAHFPSTRLTGL